MYMSVCVRMEEMERVCVCVAVRERERRRERERERERERDCSYLAKLANVFSTSFLLKKLKIIFF